MREITLLSAKSKLSELVEDLLSGEEKEFVLTQQGKPVAVLSAVRPSGLMQRIGIARGEFEIPEEIDGTNEQVRRLFEDAGDRPDSQ